MLSLDFVNLCVNSTNKAIEHYGLHLPDVLQEADSLYKQESGDELHECDLTVPEAFDKYSYAIFKSVSKCLTEAEKRKRFTQFIGNEIYLWIKCKNSLEGNRHDYIPKIKNALEKVITFFVESGYVSCARIDWAFFNEAVWKKTGKSYFVYDMKNPVILSSAKKLYLEEGFGQHYSSRALQAALLDFRIHGSEVASFDPDKFDDCVKELWMVERICG